MRTVDIFWVYTGLPTWEKEEVFVLKYDTSQKRKCEYQITPLHLTPCWISIDRQFAGYLKIYQLLVCSAESDGSLESEFEKRLRCKIERSPRTWLQWRSLYKKDCQPNDTRCSCLIKLTSFVSPAHIFDFYWLTNKLPVLGIQTYLQYYHKIYPTKISNDKRLYSVDGNVRAE